MDDLTIKSKLGAIKVSFIDDFSFLYSLFKDPRTIVITGKDFYKLYRKIFCDLPYKKLIVVPLSEKTKTLKTVIRLYRNLLDLPYKKNLTVVSLGGGINQDVVGFLAATLYRGIRWIYVPTTLLAQADSSIGLKTSLNLDSYKNIVGTFYTPKEIYISVYFLKTLSEVDFHSGVGEVLKLMLMDKRVKDKLPSIEKNILTLIKREDMDSLKRIIRKTINIKLSYMKGDEFDYGKRNLLNYGHEIGHALESACNFVIPHGVAVLYGILFANQVSFQRDWIAEKHFDLINKIVKSAFPKSLRIKKEYFNIQKILLGMRMDKKREGNDLVLVLPQKDLSLIKITDFKEKECMENLRVWIDRMQFK
jgi:3-dehydroquinate synthase